MTEKLIWSCLWLAAAAISMKPASVGDGPLEPPPLPTMQLTRTSQSVSKDSKTESDAVVNGSRSVAASMSALCKDVEKTLDLLSHNIAAVPIKLQGHLQGDCA